LRTRANSSKLGAMTAGGLTGFAGRSLVAVDTVFEGKRKRSPTTRTRAVLIADLMMLEREAALKPARQCAPLTGCGA